MYAQAVAIPHFTKSHNTCNAETATVLSEFLTAHTIDCCLRELRALISSYFTKKRDQVNYLVRGLLYHKHRDSQALLEEFFSVKELTSIQNKLQQNIKQKAFGLWGQDIPVHLICVNDFSVKFAVRCLEESVAELKHTLSVLNFARKLGNKGLGMLAGQLKIDRITIFSSYLEKAILEPEQIILHCEDKCKQCILGLINDLEEQLTEQLSTQIVDLFYNSYDQYDGSC